MNRYLNTVVSMSSLLLLFAMVATAHAGTFFSTDFSSPTLNSNLQDLTGGPNNFIIASGSIHLDGANPNSNGNGRAYITTVDSNYLDFKYTLQYTNPNTSLSFIGIGPGLNTGPSNEPGSGSLNLRLHSPDIAGGLTHIGFNGAALLTLDPIATLGTHQAVITRIGNLITFSVDNLPGDTATIDLSLPAYAAVNAAIGGGSKLFFGGAQDFVTFDNFVVTIPEPTSAILLGVGAFGVMRFRRRRQLEGC